MRAKFVGNAADRVLMNVRNGEASASIPRGTPVVLELGTAAAARDGLDVVLPATAGAAISYGCKYGVVTETLVAGQYGESILFGVSSYALLTRATRAASSDSWTSSASTASGIGLGIDTINNAFLMGASVAGAIASNAMMAILLDSVSSIAATVTSDATADTRTAITISVRAFVRML